MLAFGSFTVGLGGSAGKAFAQGAAPGIFELGVPFTAEDLPPGRLRSELKGLRPTAQGRALEWLQAFVFTELDLGYLRADQDGGIFYTDTYRPEDPQGAGGSSSLPSESEAISSAAEAFSLHSQPGAPNVFYIDFDGHAITGTAWNGGQADPIYARPFNLDGDPDSFSQDELNRIGEIWHRVAEDMAPFDIDVTTEEPASFDRYTGRILVTSDVDANGDPMPYQNSGGVAYVNVFGQSNYAYYSPAIVYYDNLGNGHPPYVAEASSHEAGHNYGLSHDGASGGTSYYSGHGSGFVSWAPIMGVGYYNNVTQWSQGEYANANNGQDDLAIIDGKLGYRFDDHGDTLAGATALVVQGSGAVEVTNPETDPDNLYPENKGVIEHRTDVDVFKFDVDPGAISLTVSPAWDAYYRSSRRGANLDVEASLYNQSGTLLAQSDPLDETDADLSLSVPAGRYYLSVTGVGNSASPYSEYGSLGQYFISGSVPTATSDTTSPTPNPMTWASSPAATGSTTVAMTGTTASDDSGVVDYFFECTVGAQSCGTSGWQSSASYGATGLAAHTLHSFRVKARDASANETGWSVFADATTDNTAPAAADDSDSVPENGQVTISVLANDDDDDGDSVYIMVANNGANGTVSHTDSTVTYTPNANYTGNDGFDYTIGDGFGGTDTATVSVTVMNQPTLPAAPTLISVNDNGDGSAKIVWADNSTNETGFEIQRQSKHKKRNSWVGTGTVATTAPDATVHDDPAGTGTYRYQVRSVNLQGPSAWTGWSGEVAVTDGSGGGGGGGGDKCHPVRGCAPGI
jgi:hypothetical protein